MLYKNDICNSILGPEIRKTKNDNSKEALHIVEWRAQVVESYTMNWIVFFLDWKQQKD